MPPHFELSSPDNDLQSVVSKRLTRPNHYFRKVPRIGFLGLSDGLSLAARQCAGGISRWRRRRAANRALEALNDHQLRDIGVDRSRIVSLVEEFTETDGQTAARFISRNRRKS